MNSRQIIQNIEYPYLINENNIMSLDQLLSNFPYFQTAQLLLARGLLNTNSLRYNSQLKKAAIYSLDRKKLFNLITLNKIEEKIKEPKESNKKLEIGKPLEFNENERHSFSEWLTLTKVKKINRNHKSKNLIDNFLDNEATISSPKEDAFLKPITLARESLIENKELVTPTLAKVYLEQGYYEKAIVTYKKLILKYPEKNSFFSNQIKLIYKLKEK